MGQVKHCYCETQHGFDPLRICLLSHVFHSAYVILKQHFSMCIGH